MNLEFVLVLEDGTSKILPKFPHALRVFLILRDRKRAKAALSGGYAVPSAALG